MTGADSTMATSASWFAMGAITCYAAGLLLRWRQRTAAASSLMPPAHTESQGNRLPLMLITLVALALHGFASYYYVEHPGGIDLGVLSVSNLVAFILVAVVALASLRLPIDDLFLFVFPISISSLLAINLIDGQSEPIMGITGPLLIHILISLAAYTTLMMAAIQSVLLAVQERRLRTPKQRGLGLLPPLETMERLHLAMVWLGLALLTASIASGYLFLEDMFAQRVAHHIVLTSLSWFVYVSFLVGRYWYGWRGLTAVRWSLAGFGFLLLGYLGSKFVVEYLLNS